MQDVVIPQFNLEGKVAVITGGTKGLGYGMARTLAHYGADVVVTSRTQADCDRVSEELRSLGRRSLGIVTDVSVSEQNDALVEQVVKEFGRIDIMICNAGVASTAFAMDITDKEWNYVMDIDLKGVFYSARAAARKMIELEIPGKIIPISSATALFGAKGLVHYCSAKAGVLNMTRALAVEWARYGITVNAVCPGYVITNMNEKDFENPKVKKGIEDKTLLKRLGKVEEITGAILFLCSDSANYMTGSSILLDGGTNAQ